MDKLPKTRSGKIVRGTIRKIANELEFIVPATIDDI
jgi:propionyl-CoA synthetase